MKKNNITKELQKVEINILKEFIRVCDKLNLNYYLIGGTLIGAVRHKGFIPWDDDIDVCMFRKDYEKFLENGQRLLKKNLFLQTYSTDIGYVNSFAKIRNNNTTFIETSVKNKNINHGAFIDIFPIDNYYHYNKVKEKLLNYAIHSELYKYNKRLIKSTAILVSNILYKRKSKEYLCKKLEKIYTKNNNKKSRKVSNFCGAWGIKRETHRIDCFKDYKVVQFEGIDVKIPIGYDEILTTTYGDYMKLPPKEEQVTHHYTDIIDTKKSYKEYININKN